MTSLRRFLARHWMLVVGVAYVVLGLVARAGGYHEEDAAWFREVTGRILDGSLDIYGLRHQPWAAPPAGMAFTYAPLVPLLLAPFVAAGRALGLTATGIDVLIGLPWLIADVLLARQIVALAADWGGGLSPRSQAIAFLLPLLTLVTPVSSAYMGHHESLVLLTILLALRARSRPAAGLWWGVALSLKTTALFGLLPVAALVIVDAWRSAGATRAKGGLARLLRPLLPFFAPLVTLPLALILPFWLRAPGDAAYALLRIESHRILYGLNVPVLIDAVAGRLAPALQPALNALLVRWTSPLLLLLCAGLALAFALRHARSAAPALPWRRPAVRAALLAALGANFTAFMVLGKWSETHYRFMPLLLLLALDETDRPAYPYVYILFALSTTLWSWAGGLSSYWRLATFSALGVYFVWRALWRERPAEDGGRSFAADRD